MKKEVVEETLNYYRELMVDRRIIGVEYDEETQEFSLVLENGLEISI